MSTELINILKRTLNGFKLQELCELTIHEFPEFTWTEVQNRLIIEKLTITKKNAIGIIGKIIEENQLDADEIKERITNLSLLAIAKSQTRTWWTYLLTDFSEEPINNEDITINVRNALRNRNVLSDIQCIKFSGQYVINVTKKTRVKRTGVMRRLGSIYFKTFIGFPYLFSSRASAEKDIVNAVGEGLGYARCEPYNLCGKNVKELLKLLRNREGQSHNAQALLETPELEYTCRETPNGISFNQESNRANYAEKVYGSTPPKIEKFSVSIKTATWVPTGGFDKMNGVSLSDATVTFKSNNAIETIKELIKHDLVVLPLPQYMQAVLCGKNIVKIRQQAPET